LFFGVPADFRLIRVIVSHRNGTRRMATAPVRPPAAHGSTRGARLDRHSTTLPTRSG